MREEIGATLSLDGLTLLPSCIDPHVHFRFPGETHKETWKSAALAAFKSGVTCVFDMPNNVPSITTVKALIEKRDEIKKYLADNDLPLHFGLYLGASAESLSEISKAGEVAIGIKIFMGGSTGSLLLADPKDQSEAFQRASDAGLVVAVHAESQAILEEKRALYPDFKEPHLHSKIRDRSAAIIAVEKALELADKHKTKLYILHVSTKEEIALIQSAKNSGVRVLAEATPHHLTFSEEDYKEHGTHLMVNPPIRSKSDVEALWKGIQEGVIDTVGSDHAPHTLAEKSKAAHLAPCGIAGIEHLLPILLTAVNEGRISLSKVIELTRTNIAKFFEIEPPNDWVLVDMAAKSEIRNENLETNAKFSPFHGRRVQGIPRYLLANGRLINLEKIPQRGSSDVHP